MLPAINRERVKDIIREIRKVLKILNVFNNFYWAIGIKI